MTQPLSPSSVATQRYVSDHKNHGQKKPGKDGQTGSPCLDRAMQAQGGGGMRRARTAGLCTVHAPCLLLASKPQAVGRQALAVSR